MLFNGKNRLLIIVLFFLTQNLSAIDITRYNILFELEDNTSDIITNKEYTKSFFLNDIFSSLEYNSFDIIEREIEINLLSDFNNLEDISLLLTDDNNVIRTENTSDKINNKKDHNSIHGNIETCLFFNDYFINRNRLALYNDKFTETFLIENNKDILVIENNINYKIISPLTLSNYSLFNWGKDKLVFNNLLFNQNKKDKSFNESFFFEYNIKEAFFKSGTEFIFSIRGIGGNTRFYFDNYKYIFGQGFSFKHNLFSIYIYNEIETDFASIYHFNFNTDIAFTYKDLISTKIFKYDNKLKGENFNEYKKKIYNYYLKDIKEITGLEFQFQKNIYSFMLLAICYHSSYFLSIDLNKTPLIPTPSIFTKIDFEINFDKFKFSITPFYEIIDLAKNNFGLEILFDNIKVAFLYLKSGYTFAVLNNIDTIENKITLKVDFKTGKIGQIYLQSSLGLRNEDIMSNIKFKPIITFETGFKAFF